MMRTTLPREEQVRLRRKHRINQTEIAKRLRCSISRVSQYETAGRALPWAQTADDYQAALDALIAERTQGAA